MIDSATSVAPDAVTDNVSVVSNTTLLPARSSSDEPAGMGALVTSCLLYTSDAADDA